MKKAITTAAVVMLMGTAVPATADVWSPTYTGTINRVYLDAQPTDELVVVGAVWPQSAKWGLEVGIYVAEGLPSARLAWGIYSSAPSGTAGSCQPTLSLDGRQLYSGAPLKGTVGAFSAGNLVPALYGPESGILLDSAQLGAVTAQTGRRDVDVSLDCGALGAATFQIPLVVLPRAPMDRQPGVSIDDGADFTNSSRVTLDLGWDGLVDKVKVSNDGGFAPSKSKDIRLDNGTPLDWTLVDLGNERLPKTVYVKLHDPLTGWSKQTYTDDIILDTVKPQVLSASVSGSGAATLAGPRMVRVKAKDNKSGLALIQVSAGKPMKKAKIVKFRKTVPAPKSGIVYVRVRDGAGNWSSWRRAG